MKACFTGTLIIAASEKYVPALHFTSYIGIMLCIYWLEATVLLFLANLLHLY